MVDNQESRPLTLERLAPLAGVLFAVLTVAAIAVWGDVLEPGSPAGERADAYVDDPERGLAGAQLLGVAAFALAWFGGTLRRAVATADDRLGAIAFGGTLVAAALILAGAAAHASLALRADELGALDAESAAVVGDFGSVLMAAVAPVGMALATGATAVAALRSGVVLPRWAAWVSVVLTVGLLAMPVNYAVSLGFLVWAAAVGIALTPRGGAGTSRSTG